MTDLASISPLVVVGARRVNGGGCGGVGQDVDEVWIHHVVVKQVKDAHSIRSICREIRGLTVYQLYIHDSSSLSRY